jgi:hypothetical protein
MSQYVNVLLDCRFCKCTKHICRCNPSVWTTTATCTIKDVQLHTHALHPVYLPALHKCLPERAKKSCSMLLSAVGVHCRWAAIQASGELRAMSRTHIHFATKPSHMRKNKWADTLLRLKLQVGGVCMTSSNVANTVLCCPELITLYLHVLPQQSEYH